MSQDQDEKLLTDEEWAKLMAADYESRGVPVDAVAKARVWRRLKSQIRPNHRASRWQWLAIVAGLVAVMGGVPLLKEHEHSREKGEGAVIPAILTPYSLEDNGSTLPASTKVKPADTIVFRTRASLEGFFVLLIRDGDEAPRLAIDEEQSIGPEDQFVRKNGELFGIKIDRGSRTRTCVAAAINKQVLAELLKDLNATFANLSGENCVSLEAQPP